MEEKGTFPKRCKPPLPGKNELQSLKLSSSIKWCSEMMKTNEGTRDNSVRKHQYTIQSQELPWIKTKIYFLSWWLTRQYFQLLIISIIGNIWREAFILEIEIGVWKCCLEWRCVLYRNSKKRLWAGEGQILTLNSAVTFSSVLTNVGTAVMEINFF